MCILCTAKQVYTPSVYADAILAEHLIHAGVVLQEAQGWLHLKLRTTQLIPAGVHNAINDSKSNCNLFTLIC